MEDLKKHQKKVQEDEIRVLQEEAARGYGAAHVGGTYVEDDEYEVDASMEAAMMEVDI